jgi:hypothetical protein
LFAISEREEAYDGESEFEIVTNDRASVVVDKRCKRARSNVRSGQVGRAIDWFEDVLEQTPSPRVNTENDMVAADHQLRILGIEA